MHVPRVVHTCTFFITRLYLNGLIYRVFRVTSKTLCLPNISKIVYLEQKHINFTQRRRERKAYIANACMCHPGQLRA